MTFISHSVFYWKIHLVLDCDTFRLELDYRSIMHILVKVLYNQDSGTRMVLIPVRVQILSLGMVAWVRWRVWASHGSKLWCDVVRLSRVSEVRHQFAFQICAWKLVCSTRMRKPQGKKANQTARGKVKKAEERRKKRQRSEELDRSSNIIVTKSVLY